MNPDIADQVRDESCTACLQHNGAVGICITGRGNARANIMIINKMPDSRGYREELDSYLREVGLDPRKIFFTGATKCRNFDRDASNADIKTCRSYLDDEISLVRPKWILTLGNEALLAATGKSGITKYRGQVFDRDDGSKVVPTISPSAVKRNPGQLQGFLADLHFFAARVDGREYGVPEPTILDVRDRDTLKRAVALLQKTDECSYDVETVGDGEWAPDAKVVSLSVTVVSKRGDISIFFPLYHPESPWRRVWVRLLQRLVPLIARIKKRTAHNGKYDDKWLWKFSGHEIHQTFDTMIAAHLLDENRPKGLKPLGQSILGVAPWGINTRNLLDTPLDEICIYNCKDTYHTLLLKRHFASELQDDLRRRRIFKYILMPASANYTKTEMDGIWVDRERLQTNTKIAEDMLADVENRLSDWIPGNTGAGDAPLTDEELIKLGWPTVGRRGKLADVNFNASKWAKWWLFDYLELPVLERGKEKPNGDPGDPSMREGVLMELKDKHPAVPIMLERVEWQKMTSSFLRPYAELLDENDRIHTTFKVTGTVTGRTSSGKEDQEKITASRGKRRGINLQQVPRNVLTRGVFGAPPPDWFIEFDFSQIELRLAAFIARARTMIRLYQQDADIHLATAARVTGLPESQVTPKIRKEVGKPVNFGFLYGMSWRKFIITAFEKYGVRFDEEEARGFRESYFDLFPELLEWHARQRRFVRKHGYAVSPIGRIRHLPDIYSPDNGVAAEAERQAINSPVQGMGSDMLQLAMNLLAPKIRKRKMPALILGTVHDALNLQAAPECMDELLPLIKDTMENLPLDKLFGVHMDVPIIADCKVGRHWGGATELTSEQVYDWRPEHVKVD